MPKQEFFPQFFRRTRPYSKAFIKDVEASLARGQANVAGQLATKAYAAALKSTAANVPLSNVRIVSELQGAAAFAQWHIRGGNVYEFDAALVEALENSDPGDVRLADLNYPFDAVYFSFGTGHDIRFASGATVTGAYVLHAPGVSLRVVLTAPLPEVEQWWNRQTEIYDVLIPAHFQHLSLSEAISLSIEADMADFRRATGLGPSFQANGEAREIEVVLRRLQDNRPAYNQAVSLIVNGLLYVTAYPQDVLERWQAGTPEKWVQKASHGTAKELERNKSKLNAMGYVRVHRVGEYFGSVVGTAERSAHWRRGHFRNQAHGPRMSLRRLVWIRPVAVLGGKMPDEDSRVYEVPLKKAVAASSAAKSSD
jgi:hypothetical protein